MGQSPICKINKNLKDQVVIITGANTGIGKETALRLASHNATIILGCRSQQRTQPVLEEIKNKYPNSNAEFIKLDLGDLNSVLEFSTQVKQKYQKIDTLLNNAGVMWPQGKFMTKQNFELQIGTNHFGHFVLTNQILPMIRRAPEGRIINVSSVGHDQFAGIKADIDLEDINFQKREYDDKLGYAQSKLANVVFTNQLQKVLDDKNYSNVKTVSLHPGVIKTELMRHFLDKSGFFMKLMVGLAQPFFKSAEQGAQTNIYCCMEDFDKLVKAEYYQDLKVGQKGKRAQDSQLDKEFWELSNKVCRDYLIEW